MDRKPTEEHLNYDFFKSGYHNLTSSWDKMALAFVRLCPRDILIKALKKKKIIKRHWLKKGVVYIERENVS